MTEDAHFRLRLPVELRDQISEMADKNQRSINAEVVARLEASLTSGADTSAMASRLAAAEAAIAVLEKNVRQLFVNDDHLITQIENLRNDADL